MDIDQIMRRKSQRLFRDRTAAGAELAQSVDLYRVHQGMRVLLLGIPRGGVMVAAQIARRLDADLDVIVARKLGAPTAPEVAIGAVTARGGRYLDEERIRHLGVPLGYLVREAAQQIAEARRCEAQLRGARPRPEVGGRLVIIVDDGLATGATMRAAIRSIRKLEPARLVVAVPVGPVSTCEALRREVDEIVCPHELDPFWSVGLCYEHFEQVDEAEVMRILQAWQADRPAMSGAG